MEAENENNINILKNMIASRTLLLEKIMEMDKEVEEHKLNLLKY